MEFYHCFFGRVLSGTFKNLVNIYDEAIFIDS